MRSSKAVSAKLAALAMAGAFALASCSGQSAPGPQPQAPEASQASAGAGADGAQKKVFITAIVDHPALDAARQGIVDGLAEKGWVDGRNLALKFQSAQGNTGIAGQITKQFISEQPDVLVAIATPSAQSFVAATKTIPIVYVAVTDPVAAELVPSFEPSGTNVTGFSDELPLESQVEFLQELVPNLKNIGYVYSPGEVNSASVLERLKKIVEPKGLQVVAAPAQRTVDIPPAARSLAGKVDLIYTSLDNNVVSSYEALAKVARDIKVPLVGSNTETIDKGAVAALGVNYRNIGLGASELVDQILRGKNPGELGSRRSDQFDLEINLDNAKAIGFVIPQSIVGRATRAVGSPSAQGAPASSPEAEQAPAAAALEDEGGAEAGKAEAPDGGAPKGGAAEPEKPAQQS